MTELLLRIGPAGAGWRLEADTLQPTYFRSGADAEAAGRRLAMQPGGAGHDVRMMVEEHGDAVVAAGRDVGG